MVEPILASAYALLYWSSARSTALLPTTDCDLKVKQTIRKPIKVRSKVALRFAGA
jgi:hypothetical protein